MQTDSLIPWGVGKKKRVKNTSGNDEKTMWDIFLFFLHFSNKESVIISTNVLETFAAHYLSRALLSTLCWTLSWLSLFCFATLSTLTTAEYLSVVNKDRMLPSQKHLLNANCISSLFWDRSLKFKDINCKRMLYCILLVHATVQHSTHMNLCVGPNCIFHGSYKY